MSKRTVFPITLALFIAASCEPGTPEPSVEGLRAALVTPPPVCVARRPPFDFNGMLADGQSLASGFVPPGVAGTSLSVTQPFNNVMLTDTGPNPRWPRAGTGTYSFVPLVEPNRPAVLPGWTATNASYPLNQLPGSEAPSTHAANELTRRWRERWGTDYVVAHTNVAINSAPLATLAKGSTTWSYGAALAEAATMRTLAEQVYGKRYGVVGILFTHGQADAALHTPDYRPRFVQLYDDLAADLACVTGQPRPPVLFATQPSAIASGLAGVPIQMLGAAADRPAGIVIVGPTYQYPTIDGKHPTPWGYWLMGEKYAEVWDTVINLGLPWHPLQPLAAARGGNIVRVAFDVAFPPLAWDDTIADPWPSVGLPVHFGRGFEVRDAAGTYVWIAAAALEPPATVRLDLGRNGAVVPPGPLTVSYATAGPRGQLRDSDPAVGGGTGAPLWNYAVHAVITTTPP